MDASAGLKWTHPSRRFYRFGILVIVSFFLYGSYFAYDSVGAIEDYLMEHMKIGQSDIGSMYSLYSWGAIVTLFFAGWLIDRIGTRKSSMLCKIFRPLAVILSAMSKSLNVPRWNPV